MCVGGEREKEEVCLLLSGFGLRWFLSRFVWVGFIVVLRFWFKVEHKEKTTKEKKKKRGRIRAAFGTEKRREERRRGREKEK